MAARRLRPAGRPRERPLSAREELAWYVVAGTTYIAAGTAQKALLTWLVGPAWVVATLWLGPALVDVLASRRRRWTP